MAAIDPGFNFTYVRYASNIYIELYHNTVQDTFSVRTVYNGKPIEFAECASSMCALDDFFRHIEVTLGDFYKDDKKLKA